MVWLVAAEKWKARYGLSTFIGLKAIALVWAIAGLGRAVIESDELTDGPAVLGSHGQELL